MKSWTSLTGRNLFKSYGARSIVSDVSLNVPRGRVTGLLGPNGAGKTSTFYMMVGLLPPDQGSVHLDAQEITHWPLHQRAQQGLAYLPQEASIFRKLTVYENIACVFENLNIDLTQSKPEIDLLVEEFGLGRILNQRGFTLSGGERRRVEIARALALNPSFLLLDEPFAGIDPIAVNDIQAIIRKLCQKNLGILITDHNVRETLAICDYATILADGKLLAEGTPNEIVNNPIAKSRYLGESFS